MRSRAQRVALVTGGGRGIGRAIAQAFSAEGLAVVIADVSPALGHATERELRERGAEVHSVPTDVADDTSVRQLMASVGDRFGHLDVLVNNAGISRSGPFEELSAADWDRVLGVNLRGAFLCARMGLDLLRRAPDGSASIINIASTRAVMSEPGNEAYAASKAGLLGLTHALANSLGPGVRVNAILPGWIDTHGGPLRDEDHAQHPAGRVGRPEDIAAACVFLASPAAGFITGQQLVIDGGMTRKMIYVPDD